MFGNSGNLSIELSELTESECIASDRCGKFSTVNKVDAKFTRSSDLESLNG